MSFARVLIMILVMAGVTYLIRMLPLVIFRKKINSQFLQSFLYYIPYGVLSAMTVPYIFYSTGNIVSAIAGTCVALLLAFRDKSLIVVALAAVAAAYISDLAVNIIV